MKKLEITVTENPENDLVVYNIHHEGFNNNELIGILSVIQLSLIKNLNMELNENPPK
jgi:hypothetical protein